MNRRDFYKELMDEYAFDKDKILNNAKKGKYAGRKPLPLYIGMTAAAAAVIVAVGSVTLSTGNRGGIRWYSDGTLAALPDKDRIDKAKTEIIANENSETPVDAMVSFNGALSPAEVQSVLTAYSANSVPVKLLYFSDGSRAVGSEQVGAVFESGIGEITGAIINCPGSMMKPLMSSDRVLLVEIASDEDFNTAVPISPIGDLTDFDNLFDSDDSQNSTNTDVINPGIDEDDNSYNSDSSDYSNNESSDNNDKPVESNDSDNSSADPNVSGTITQPQDAEIKLPEGVSLPNGHSVGFSYITDDLGAERAYFLNENVFYVKTANSVRLYKWGGESETLAAAQDIEDAQVCWISENGSRLMVTGKENGIRRKMFIVDARNCTINDMNVEDFVEGGTIAAAAYNENDDVLAVNVLDGNNYYLFSAHLNGYQAADAETLFSRGNNVNILGERNGTVYFSETSGNKTTIYKGDGIKVSELSGSYSANVNSAFTHAVMNGDSGSFIFDPATESVLSVNGSVSFGVSLHTFAMGDDYYKVENGSIVKASKSIDNAAKIDFKRSFSSTYAALVSNGSVRIVPSVYNSASKRAVIEQPAENSAKELRTALNLGAGMINALASDKCAESGLDTAEKLSGAISECFTKSAGDTLKSRNANGSLVSIDISEAVLVISENNGNSAEGSLYVKVGTFDGKSGYIKYSVRFAKERGCFRLDCVIG